MGLAVHASLVRPSQACGAKPSKTKRKKNSTTDIRKTTLSRQQEQEIARFDREEEEEEEESRQLFNEESSARENSRCSKGVGQSVLSAAREASGKTLGAATQAGRAVARSIATTADHAVQSIAATTSHRSGDRAAGAGADVGASATTYTAVLKRTPLGLGCSLDDDSVVTEVRADSQAASAGIQRGDQVLSVNAEAIKAKRGAALLLQGLPFGSSVEIELSRRDGAAASTPDAESVRKALAEHGARIKAEALAEAEAEASAMKAEAQTMLADANAQAQRTEATAEIALGAVASIAASAQRRSAKGSMPRPAFRRTDSAELRAARRAAAPRPAPGEPAPTNALNVGLSEGLGARPSLKAAIQTVQTTVHIERKMTLRRQGLLQGRHAPLPEGLPSRLPPQVQVARHDRPSAAAGVGSSAHAKDDDDEYDQYDDVKV